MFDEPRGSSRPKKDPTQSLHLFPAFIFSCTPNEPQGLGTVYRFISYCSFLPPAFFPWLPSPSGDMLRSTTGKPAQKKPESSCKCRMGRRTGHTHTLSASFSLFLALSLSRSIFLPGNHPANRKPGTPPNYDVQENTTSYRMFVTHFFFWAALPRLVLVGHVRKHPRRPRYPVDTFFFFFGEDLS